MRMLLILAPILALSACATAPERRVVRSEFQCVAGPKLRVSFNLDQKTAIVRLEESTLPPVTLQAQKAGAGRNYATEGFSLVGVGDQITWSMTGFPSMTCTESR